MGERPPAVEQDEDLLREFRSHEHDDALSEDEALTLAYDELKAMRRERRVSGKAAS